MTCRGENDTNGSYFPVFSEDVAFACCFVTTRPPPTLPHYRRASGIGYACKKLSKMAGNPASYPVYSRYNELPYSWFLSRGINNRVRWYAAVLKSAVFNAPLLIVTWEIVKTEHHRRRISLCDYFKGKGPLPGPKGSLARIIPSSAIAEFSFTWQIQL